MQQAIQIELGQGKVAIEPFSDGEGEARGLIFRDTGTPHEIGSLTGEPAGMHEPQPGEIYLRCSNYQSLSVLHKMVCEMFDKWTEEIGFAR